MLEFTSLISNIPASLFFVFFCFLMHVLECDISVSFIGWSKPCFIQADFDFPLDRMDTH